MEGFSLFRKGIHQSQKGTKMNDAIMKARDFDSWLFNPLPEETICPNPFHMTMQKVFEGRFSALDPYAPDPEHIHTKIANLIKAQLILLEGDVVYVREHNELHPLNEALSLLAYYMHTDQREALKAANIIESNFQGYFPITQNLVIRDAITLLYPWGDQRTVNLKTLDDVEDPVGKYPEFGVFKVDPDTFEPIAKFFDTVNTLGIGDPYFFEKMMLYPFNQPYREKSHVLVGGGGNGKSMFMNMVNRLYGDKALTDAPQPTFKGHDPQVIAYSFIGKRVVTFNDVGDPSSQFLEWLKRMITGNLEVKTPSGAWMSVPCNANFFMETNHHPEVLNIEAHKRRYIIREFDSSFKLKDYMTDDELDYIGERGSLTAGDIANYLITVAPAIDDWTKF